MGERGVWLVPDPCGLFCSSVAWFLIFFADYVTCVGIVWPWLEQTRLLHIAVLNFWAGMAIVSQLVCMLTDPGAIAKPTPDSENKELESQDNSGMRRCLKCGGIKPFRAHHCSVCQRCIMLMDHHCPWVNNCVGMYNQKHFLLFLLYVLFMSIHVMILLIARVVSCASFDYTHKRDYWRARRRNPSPFQSPIVFFEAIVFGLFTLVMFCDQLSAVFSNATGIDQLQNTAGPQRSTCEALRQVFGTPLSIYWFLPTAVHFSFKKGGEDEREMIPWMSDVPWEQLETPPKEFFRSRSPLLACRKSDTLT
ncbi:unnamed protein product [Vitrella brassicaformis CCMP3155]|uniref:Palmitoyltransferase n=1 Tax=Vitrella brassicaformis (strain CCMP3155) TaxID=1169540 RepID=A0A0G4FE61_VITBC|nr:unnamed protein product [Vitrella brassicaformis CCMP3155]|eukprot:CEM11496.1 unnamed protein product [Vitrella brassicaformis CCMP3155]